MRLGSPPQYAPAPPWLLTLKSVWESHVTWGTPVQSFVFLCLLVFQLEPMYATSDRQTDGRTDRRTTDADDRLLPPPPLRGWGHNNGPGRAGYIMYLWDQWPPGPVNCLQYTDTPRNRDCDFGDISIFTFPSSPKCHFFLLFMFCVILKLNDLLQV